MFNEFYGRLPLDGEGMSYLSTTIFVKTRLSKLTMEALTLKLHMLVSVLQET